MPSWSAYSPRQDEKGHEYRTNGPRCSLRRRRTIGRPSIAALTGRDLSTVVVRRREHWSLFWQRKLPQEQRNKLREEPQIIAAATRRILHGHASCQQRHKAPFPIADRLYRVLRWTKPGSLPWLLLSLLVCTPIVRAQVTGFDNQVVEILGTVFAEAGNRPLDGAIVSIRSVTGGPFVSILTDSSGRFQARGLDPGTYEIAVEEPSYEPTRLTLQLPREPSRPLELYLKASNPSAVPRMDYAVSVRELRIPMKARNAFERDCNVWQSMIRSAA